VSSTRVVVVAESAEDTPDGVAFAALARALDALDPGSVRVLFLHGGPLAASLARDIPVVVNDELPRRGLAAAVDNLSHRLKLARLWASIRRRRLGGLEAGAWYLDSVRAAQALRYAGLGGRSTTTQVVVRVVPDPELDEVTGADRDLVARSATRLVCGTGAAAAEVVGRLEVPASRVEVVPEVVVIEEREPVSPSDGGAGPWVLGLGPTTFRRDAHTEGRDLFARLVGVLARRHPEHGCRVAWLTSRDDDPMRFLADHDVRVAGVADELEHRSPADLEQAEQADVLVLTARPGGVQEVAVDAVRAGVPLVAFEGVEGAPTDALVPFLDLEAMADAVVRALPTTGDGGDGLPRTGAGAGVIAAVAPAGWRGGGEQLVGVAHALRRLEADARLVVAVEPDPQAPGWLAHDVEQAGLSDLVELVPWGQAAALLTAADVALSTARRAELAGPLLEAASAGVPMVVVAGTPLADAVTADGAGTVVPPLDPSAMAAAALAVLARPERRRSLAAGARAGIAGRHAPAAVAPVLHQLLGVG